MTKQTVQEPKTIKKTKTFTRTEFWRVLAPWAIIILSLAFIAGAYWGNWSTTNMNERIQSEAAALVSELKVQE